MRPISLQQYRPRSEPSILALFLTAISLWATYLLIMIAIGWTARALRFLPFAIVIPVWMIVTVATPWRKWKLPSLPSIEALGADRPVIAYAGHHLPTLEYLEGLPERFECERFSGTFWERLMGQRWWRIAFAGTFLILTGTTIGKRFLGAGLLQSYIIGVLTWIATLGLLLVPFALFVASVVSPSNVITAPGLIRTRSSRGTIDFPVTKGFVARIIDGRSPSTRNPLLSRTVDVTLRNQLGTTVQLHASGKSLEQFWKAVASSHDTNPALLDGL